MKKIATIATITLMLAMSSQTMAYTTSAPTQYSALQWNVSGRTGLESFATCQSMTLNGIADLNNSSVINFSGTLNCNNGAFVVSGAAYINNVGGISMGLRIAGSYYWTCETNSAFNGSCNAIFTSTGAIIGTPSISFR